MSAGATEPAWGVDSEYGRLRDVLLCPPDHFRWLPSSAISRATLASGDAFDSEGEEGGDGAGGGFVFLLE